MQGRAQMTPPKASAAIWRVRPVLGGPVVVETGSAARQAEPATGAKGWTAEPIETAEGQTRDLADRDIRSLDVFELQLLAARRMFEAWLP